MNVLVPLQAGLLHTVSTFGLLAPVTFTKTGGPANLSLAANGQVTAAAALTAGQTQSITGTAIGADGWGGPFTLNLTGAVTLAALTLSALTATTGNLWSATINGRTSGSTITATSSDGTVLTVSGSTVSGTFSAAGSRTVTLTETLAGATNSGRQSTAGLTVTLSPTLAPLVLAGLPAQLTVGTPATGAITGATAGSAISATGLPAGFTIDGAARTWSYSGAGSAGTASVTLTETLAGATNTPRPTPISITIAAAAGGGTALPAPTLSRPAGVTNTTFPPQIRFSRPGDWMDGDIAVMQRSQDPTFATGVTEVTNTIFSGTGSYNFGLSAVVSGSWFFRMAAWRDGRPGSLNWSNVMNFGDTVAPTLSRTVGNMTERLPMAITINSDELLADATLGGTDGALLEVVGTFPTTTLTVRLLGNANLDFETKASYSFTVTATDLAGNVSTPLAVTEAVGDVDEIPTLGSSFNFVAVTGAARNSSQAFSYTVAGLAAGVTVPASVNTGTFTRNGTTVSNGTLVQNGDVLAFSVTASAEYLTTTQVTLNVGGFTSTANVTTLSDPAAVPAFAYIAGGEYLNDNYASTSRTYTGLDVGAPKVNRHLLVAVATRWGGGNSSVTVNGNAATLVGSVFFNENSSGNTHLRIFRAQIPTGTTADVTVSLAGTTASEIGVAFAKIEDVAAVPTSVATIDGSQPGATSLNYQSPHAIPITVPAGGFALIFHDFRTVNVTPTGFGVATFRGRVSRATPNRQLVVSSATSSGNAGITLSNDSLRNIVALSFQP